MIYLKNTKNTILKKDIDNLFKKLRINNNQKNCETKNIKDYKLHTKFPSKFSQGNLTMTNSTK